MRFFKTACVAVLLTACTGSDEPPAAGDGAASDIESRLAMYTTVRLTSDMAGLTERDRQVVGLLIDAAAEMDSIFWRQAFGEPDSLLAFLDDATRRFAEINYGPWDRLANNEPFVAGLGPSRRAPTSIPRT
jgi:hypothetical protein